MAWLLIAGIAGALPDALARADSQGVRAWEIDGIRLERGQVERLAEEMAERTVGAVEEKVQGIELRDEQRPVMREIYREVALDVYKQVVELIERSDLDDGARQEQIRELVLAGQQRSHDRLASVLDEEQMEKYAAWEKEQVEAFKSRRSDPRRRRRNR